MLLERFFPQPFVNFLDRKKSQKNSKSGQKSKFSNFVCIFVIYTKNCINPQNFEKIGGPHKPNLANKINLFQDLSKMIYQVMIKLVSS